ncbi:alpha/beta fold hydrolase [Sulfurospirillum halorespirans]|uniref:Alpha/beta hydrolase family protein n=1 Tax=Sulfurospirillum halorespirans DSM 13726 TaxID=1193502 RepID=A0A1D7TJ49_9BACT|nr:alpha/beta hydrolase [Sulfurospirillum halorespirans]AOO65021.1 alpha/beta hydrolase family protein [Sulfurospirillum halorespirans DSM 13726]
MAIADYFQGFERKMIDVGENIQINTLIGGSGEEAILLLHGHPESYLIWRDIAPTLAQKYTVIATDLRGYGDSSKPKGLSDHSNYSKRVMAQDQVSVMQTLGFSKFHIVGHDRGARVCHRLMLDHPEKVLTCTMMDILPTLDMYEQTNCEFATKYWHWFFYIQAYDFPERFLGADPEYFIRNNLLKKATPEAQKNFPEEVLQEYIRHYSDPATVHGISEDYRASASIDLEHDTRDRPFTIQTPLLVLWGANGVVGNIWNVLEGWQKYASDVQGFGVKECGHFVPEEKPQVVLEALLQFLEEKKTKG